MFQTLLLCSSFLIPSEGSSRSFKQCVKSSAALVLTPPGSNLLLLSSHGKLLPLLYARSFCLTFSLSQSIYRNAALPKYTVSQHLFSYFAGGSYRCEKLPHAAQGTDWLLKTLTSGHVQMKQKPCTLGLKGNKHAIT